MIKRVELFGAGFQEQAWCRQRLLASAADYFLPQGIQGKIIGRPTIYAGDSDFFSHFSF